MTKTTTAATAIALLALGACASGPETPGPTAARDPQPGALGGTAWRLVAIQSMDDSRYVPAADAAYTLAFGDDGIVTLQADCNRGRGMFFAPPEGGLTFGPLALTRRLCGPDSLHDRFLSDLSHVRSFVLEDGNLYLATMADGAILEFEPLP